MTKISFKYMTAAQIKQHLPDELPNDLRYPVQESYQHKTNKDVLEVIVVLNDAGDTATVLLSPEEYEALPSAEVDYVCCQ